MNVSDPDALGPVRAMIRQLSSEATEEVRHVLRTVLNAPPTAAERRVKELSLLTKLLEEKPQKDGRRPHVLRKVYDKRREIEGRKAPTSGRLQKRFGSWPGACHAAWGLRHDGRWFGDTQPWPRPSRRRKNYTVEDAKASVQRCARAIGRVPSSFQYHQWVITRRARARALGQDVSPYVPVSTVYRLVAPDRANRNGWRLITERIFASKEVANATDAEMTPANEDTQGT